MCLNIPKVLSYILVWTALLLCLGCSNTNNAEQQKTSESSEGTAGLPQGLIQETIVFNDSVTFGIRTDSLAELFLTLGFKREAEVILSDLEGYNTHWWLKKYSRSRLGKAPEFPTEQDLASIVEIRQSAFKKVWQYKVEQWSFESDVAAQRWYDLAKYAKGRAGSYYLEKPPNDFWLEGSKLYFIMSTTASDWFEHSDQVIENFSGMTVGEIRDGRK